jgi:hypothetical protein
MRKKLFVGMFLAAIAGIVAGEYLFNRSGAQDAPKKAVPDEKKTEGNLFDILTKDLNAKKDPVDMVPPPLPLPPPVTPPTVDAKDQIPPPSAPKPDVAVPPPPKVNDPKTALPPLPGPAPPPLPDQIPPPSGPKPDVAVPPPPKVNDSKTARPPLPAPASTPQVAPPLIINQAPMPPAVSDKPQTLEPKEGEPLPHQTPPNPIRQLGSGNLPPLSKPKTDDPSPLPTHSLLGGKPPMQPIVEQVAKLKNCPWSLQVDMVDGRTVVTAMVNKKHEFKIVCESLDMQTGKGTLRASGKVQISSDTLDGVCEHLEIPLMEDRLVLEGGAEVHISIGAANISNMKPAAFELKSQTLNLRIGDLQSGKVTQAGWNVPPAPLPNSVAVDGNYPATNTPGTPASRFYIGEAPLTGPWTGYGILRRTKDDYNGRPVWCLEGRDGRRFGRFVAREGGKLDAFEGQTLSVYLQSDKVMSYATHIALP